MSMGYDERLSEMAKRRSQHIKDRYVKTSMGTFYTGPKFGGLSACRTSEDVRKAEQRRIEEERRIKQRRIDEARKAEERRIEEARKAEERRKEEETKAKLAKKVKQKEERKNQKNIFINRITNKCEDILKEKNIIFDVIDKIDDASVLEKLISIMEKENIELCKEIKGNENSSNKITLMIVCLVLGILSTTIGLELIGIINLLYTSGTLIDLTKKSNAKKQRLNAINYLNIKLEENIKKYEELKEENNEIKEIKIKNLKILKNLNNSISLYYNNNYDNKICYKNYKKYYRSIKEINCVDVGYGFIEDNQNTNQINKSKTLVKKL